MTGASTDIANGRVRSESETRRLAADLAGVVSAGDILCLIGDLGAGKSSFARAFIRALTTPEEEVPSPTFTIVQTYDVGESPDCMEIWHVDLYRLSDPGEIAELGIEDAFEDAVTLIEWPERAAGLIPAKRLEIELSFCDKPSERLVAIRGGETWAGRLRGMAIVGEV